MVQRRMTSRDGKNKSKLESKFFSNAAFFSISPAKDEIKIFTIKNQISYIFQVNRRIILTRS